MTAESDKLKVIHAGYQANLSAETGQWLRAAQFYVEAARAAFLLNGPHRDETRSIFEGVRKCSDAENCGMCKGCPPASRRDLKPANIEEQAEKVIDHTKTFVGLRAEHDWKEVCYKGSATGHFVCSECHAERVAGRNHGACPGKPEVKGVPRRDIKAVQAVDIEKCLRCGREAEFHVVGPTDEHGVMFEEFWCKACYPGPGGD